MLQGQKGKGNDEAGKGQGDEVGEQKMDREGAEVMPGQGSCSDLAGDGH